MTVTAGEVSTKTAFNSVRQETRYQVRQIIDSVINQNVAKPECSREV